MTTNPVDPPNPYASPTEINEPRRLYTHARQFPHLDGLSDPEIRAIARRAMDRHPKLRMIMRTRNVVVLGSIAATISAALLFRRNLGLAMMVSGALGTLALLAWNVVWVNTVLFRITKEEAEIGGVTQE
jgi:hypothetical protein